MASSDPQEQDCSCQPEAITKGRPERSVCYTCGRPLYCERHGSNYADKACGPGPCSESRCACQKCWPGGIADEYDISSARRGGEQ